MEHSKIIRRDDGTKLQIHVSLILGYLYTDEPRYTAHASICQPRKRKFTPLMDYHDYTYRRLSGAQRVTFETEEMLKVVTASEILATKMELWQKLKPI